MSKDKVYHKLIKTPPKLKMPAKDARQVIVEVVSCMCDNKYLFRFTKNKFGDFGLRCIGTGTSIPHSYSNFGIGHDRDELTWAADEGKWDKVFEMINTGYQQVSGVRSR